MKLPIQLSDIQEAANCFSGVVKHTPLEHSKSVSKRVGCDVFLKCENLQAAGSFKIRGAMNKLRSLTSKEREKGVVASSAGNHAQGVAYAGSHFGIKSHIVMPVTAPLVKVTATRNYGAEVILKGDFFDQAYEYARELEKEKGYTFVHAYEDPMIIAGQGTVGLEIMSDIKDLDSIVVPIGGGGLISGIATAVKALNPSCRVYGVQTHAAPSIAESFKRKAIVKIDSNASTMADGVLIKAVSAHILDQYIFKLIDNVITVGEDEIADAIVFLMERAKMVVEGSGALAFAAALTGKLNLGKKTALILSGGNIDLNIVAKVIERGMKRGGRLTKITAAVEDRPGGLVRLANAIASRRANIIQVIHDRNAEGLLLGETAIEFVLETSGFEHIESLKQDIRSAGMRILG